MPLPDTWGIRYLLLVCNRLPPNLAAQSNKHDCLMFLWVRSRVVLDQGPSWGCKSSCWLGLLSSGVRWSASKLIVWLYFLAGYCLDTSFFLPCGPSRRLPQCPHSMAPRSPWGNCLKERKGPRWKFAVFYNLSLGVPRIILLYFVGDTE